MSDAAMILCIVGLLMLALAMPLFGIWALNLLFGFTIPYTFKTWLAVMVLAMLVGGSSGAGNAVSS